MTILTHTEFSHRTRAYNLARMRAEMFDILVIGAGIMGAGIAREAALRGYKVALVEKNDYASGATSQSSPLLGFEIGDLETSRFDRLYEVGQEQRRLAPLSPNHITSLPLVLPTYRSLHHDSALINLGLWMYDGLPISRSDVRHQVLTTEQIISSFPHLDVADIAGGVRYMVSRTDGARLALETVRSAHFHRAVVANHFQVEEIIRPVGKQAGGVVARDRLSGETISIRSRLVVSASGPWTGQVLALEPPRTPASRPLLKSVHILAPRKFFPASDGIAVRIKGDGHWLFVVPAGDFAFIGPCESEYRGAPDQARAEVQDVDYILRAVTESFPGARLGTRDVISTFCGLRSAGSKKSPVKPDLVARERETWLTPGGLLVAERSDLTSHRTRAQRLMAHAEKILARDFGVHGSHPVRTAQLPLVERAGDGNELTVQQAALLESLPVKTRENLEQAYGLRKVEVLEYAASDNRLCAPIVNGFPDIWAEVPHAVEQEMAMTVGDVMARRLNLFYQVPDGATGAAQEVARYISRFLDWIDSDIEQEVTDYKASVVLNRQSLQR